MKNQQQEHFDEVLVTVGADTAAGDVKVVGGLIGIASTSIANGSSGIFKVTGEYDLPKKAAIEPTQGSGVFWDPVAKVITNDPEDAVPAGVVVTAPAAADATVRVAINVRVPAEAVEALEESTPITAVPGTFADEAAVQTYLAGANVMPNIEARLAALETAYNALVAAIQASGGMNGPTSEA